jgi:hypothetical protein
VLPLDRIAQGDLTQRGLEEGIKAPGRFAQILAQKRANMPMQAPAALPSSKAEPLLWLAF